jgi:response regulator RpfG family c-di-GMP phosphodiesterase
MKKVIIADPVLQSLTGDKGILQRADIRLLAARTNDEILSLHRSEKANLIISQLDMPGMLTENLLAEVRKDKDMQKVSLIMFTAGRAGDKSRAQRCNANEIMTFPIDKTSLFEKTQRLLNIPWRESYRVLLSVSIEGKDREKGFFCKSENISATGMLLETDRSLAEGDRLTCAFFLPDSKQITATGNIVRRIGRADQSGSRKYGVKFEQISPDARHAIESFVKKKTQKSQ